MKTVPERRSIGYFRNLLKYTQMAKDLRWAEQELAELRVSMIEMERMLLEEELQYARKRTKVAETHAYNQFEIQSRLYETYFKINDDSDTDSTSDTHVSTGLTLVSSFSSKTFPNSPPRCRGGGER